MDKLLTRQQQLAMIKEGLRNSRVDVSCSKGKASGLIRVMRDGIVLREHDWKDLNTKREVVMFINSAAVSVHQTKDDVLKALRNEQAAEQARLFGLDSLIS